MNSGIAFKLNNISKFYKLYNSPKDRLKEALNPFGKKYHKEFYALKHIDFALKKGEVCGIVGKNGSGKSTLLKIISGVLQPNSGAVTVNGTVSALLEIGGGFNPEFTGLQNIFFYGTVLGFSRKEIDRRMEDIISFADIGEFLYQPMRSYSSGMRARLGFAVAINIDPNILIIDEVLAVGDELFRRKCFAKIKSFMDEGKTILFVTHNINAINELCTQAALLDNGELILTGSAKLITSQYQRLIFTKSENIEKIRKDILNINKDDLEKRKFMVDVLSDENHQSKEESQLKTTPNQKAFLNSEFKPKSTVVLKNFNVEISHVSIESLKGEKVNMLVMNEEYIYSYKAKFNEQAKKVIFSMQFQNEKGLGITGDRFPQDKKKYIEKINPGEEFLIRWFFQCNLLPGTYYGSAAAACFKDDNKHKVLYRIVDAIAFKVQAVPDLTNWGIVSLNQKITIERQYSK